MRIGLFTDSYHPATNGITVVVDIIKSNLEAMGHEVFIVAPVPTLRFWRIKHEPYVVRIPAIKGLFFAEQLTSIFFPPRELRKITKLKLDATVIFTPAQIGLMGVYSALSNNTALISQYSTDLTEYVERYPAVMPGVLALYAAMPFAFKSKPKELFTFTKSFRKTENSSHLSWRQHSIQTTLTFLHNRCDAVIAVSPKIATLLSNWQTTSPVCTIPTGVNLGATDPKKVASFKRKYGIKNDDKVLLSLGRVAEEKNLDLLVDAMPFVIKKEPRAKLIIAGGFSYRGTLERKVDSLGLHDHVIFTGHIPMADRWSMYAIADIFCFPSLTDTQALVVNEAALMNLPIIWCDDDVNEVLQNKITGLKAPNHPEQFASTTLKLLSDTNLCCEYGKNAHKRALQFSEQNQTKKLYKVIEKAVSNRSKL